VTVVYIATPGSTVRRKGERLQVWQGNSKVSDLRLFDLERLVIMGPIQLTTQAMLLLLDRGIDVSFMTSRGRPRGALVSGHSRNIFLRLAQFDRWRDEAFRLSLAREVVLGKLSAQRQIIMRYIRNHPGTLESDAPDRIQTLIERVNTAGDIDELMGMEGAGAAIYYRQFGRMLSSLPFPGRKKHPATDPANALLSLGYVLLTNEIAGLLTSHGFDPFIGFYHGIRYGRQSLSLDVVEVFRQPVIDRLCLRLLNRKQITEKDFEGGKGGLRLQPEPLKLFLESYDNNLRESNDGDCSWREHLCHQVEDLKSMIINGVPTKMYTWTG
jgi:CRISP-associated protein Cas1